MLAVHQTQPANIDMKSGASRSAALTLALFGLVVIAAVLSFAKDYSHELNPWGDPYFFFSYSDGFIKRGLVGHIFNTVHPGASPEATRAVALWSFTITSLLIIALLMVWFFQVAREWIALFALFAASQFLPTLGCDTGYLDAYVYVLAIIAFIAFAHDRLLIVAVTGFMGPFVHESFVFLWLPLAILAVWRGGLKPVHAVALCAPVLSALIIYYGHSQGAAIAQVNAAPISDTMKDTFITGQFGLRLMTVAREMWFNKISPHSVNYVVAFVFYTLPGALIALSYASKSKDRMALLLATYAPALNSLIAWDLSRFLVVTSLSAVTGVLFMQSIRPTIPTKGLLACWTFAALLFAMPAIYAFYDHAYIFKGGPLGFNNTPWAKIIQMDVIPWYNRDMPHG